VLFAGDVLRAGDSPASFPWCPGKVTQGLQPKSEVQVDGKQIKLRSGKLTESSPARACFLPGVARLGAASEQHYGVSLTRGLPQDEGLVAPAQLPEAVRKQLEPVEQALQADSKDLPALLSRAAIFEKNGLTANAAHEYRTVSRLFPDAL